MGGIPVELGADLVVVLRQGDQPVARRARELIVLELYRRGTLSSGKAAELLRMPREEFIRPASRLGIPYLAMSADEWAVERTRSAAL